MTDDQDMRRSDQFRAAMAADGADLEPQGPEGGIRERRVEWVTWGLSIIFLGVAIVAGGNQPLARTNDALWILFPIATGGLLLVSAILQKIIKDWDVSFVTWILGPVLAVFGILQVVDIELPRNRQLNPIVLISVLVIAAGVVIVFFGVRQE